jgi:glycerol-3-phosphate acyltransferase PlsX
VSDKVTIAIDAMGGDRAPAMVVRGADIALERHPNTRFLIFGAEDQIAPLVAKLPRLQEAAELHHTDEVVLDDAKPSLALRTGRNSSMRLAIDAVADGRADGVVPRATPAR